MTHALLRGLAHEPPIVAAAFSLVAMGGLMMACGGTSGSDAIESAEPQLGGAATLASGDFATTEDAGGQLDPFGCRHYLEMHLSGGASSPKAVMEPKLDSADKADIDPDGSCGGVELPKNGSSTYPLKFVERTSCGAGVFEGTIKWTTDGKVTRTLHLADYRMGTYKTKPARVVAAITSTSKGETNTIGTTTASTAEPRARGAQKARKRRTKGAQKQSGELRRARRSSHGRFATPMGIEPMFPT